ncbi:MAG: hypothetical protein INR73_17415 [Williamsia sp.]|nr:hypothetical protein [Williamsia sp.]
MSDQEPTANPAYQKGFNEGYIMMKYLPQLAEEISKGLGDSDRSSGFKDGKAEYQLEKAKEHLPSWLKRDFTKKDVSNDKSERTKGKEADRDKE